MIKIAFQVYFVQPIKILPCYCWRGDVNTIDFCETMGLPSDHFVDKTPVDRLISSFRAIQGSETRKSKCEITELKSDDWLIRHVKNYSYIHNLAKVNRLKRLFIGLKEVSRLLQLLKMLNFLLNN